jgi:hypothetical protein
LFCDLQRILDLSQKDYAKPSDGEQPTADEPPVMPHKGPKTNTDNSSVAANEEAKKQENNATDN